ncbi:Pyrimidine-specific ribonucleoside hydrolase RihA [Planctopirus ephydatiae]|uniref:Pyrimidine-specific ribonucleoside hydrolase RihA n=1 Tax=Planctopirus ephydatiae TaxID=2528019 RepID=A0A518GM32_9PLAN|nr:nucleoside hydrolase [Planctopirus ephydatiae]QDV29712.1 Pyrimidine-specific ribonucleoside hydrolase RihA [Planctopirus ephydatiae]
MNPIRLLIDADPGLGDALAIAIALKDPRLDVVGLTAVGSFISAKQAAVNLQELVTIIDPQRWPRLGVQLTDAHESTASVPSQQLTHYRQLNGENGMADWPCRNVDAAHPKEAAKVIIELSRAYPQELVILSLGPLTNISLAAEKDPELLMRLKGLVISGGTLEGPGNITPAADFNIYQDPLAARSILKSACTKTLVPFDASQKVGISFGLLDRLPIEHMGRFGEWLQTIVPFALRSHHQFQGMESWRLPELVALAAVVKPEFFQHLTLAVDVETDAHLTRGMTVFDRRSPPVWRPNVEVLKDPEVQGILDDFMSVLRSTVV